MAGESAWDAQTSVTTAEGSTPRARGEDRFAPSLRLVCASGRARDEPSIRLAQGVTVIGSDAASGIRLDDPLVAPSHAAVEVDPQRKRVTLLAAQSATVEVDGRAVARATLQDGQLVSLGHTHGVLRLHEPASSAELAAMVGVAPSMARARELIGLLAPTGAVVLLLGESGVGKDVAARALHEASGRQGPFVAVNCSAIPDALAESQLFGHVRGAFTGAREGVDGMFRAASGGTLFLDEVAELPPATQSRLLRALDTGAVVPVGTAREVPHCARVIAATSRDLVDDVTQGRFRRDLFARISDFVITLPPLRERREDILPLLRHAYGEPLPLMRPRLARALLLHAWPFNVREVVRLAKFLRIVARDAPVLSLSMVAERLGQARRAAGLGPAEPEGRPSAEDLAACLRRHRGRVDGVARELRRSRRQVYRWIRHDGLDPRSMRGRGDTRNSS